MAKTNRFQYIAEYIFQTSGVEKVKIAQETAVKNTRAMNTILEKQGAAFRASSLNSGQYTDRVDKSGKAVRDFKLQVTDSDGKLRDLNFTTGKVGRSTQILEGSFKSSTKTSKEHAASLVKTEQGYAKLALRAIAVIPIWMALRGVYSGLISVFTDGFKVWREMNTAMLKAEAVIHGSTKSIGDSVDVLSEKISNLSIESGTKMQELASSFYRFGTVGLDFETSMGGMEASNKAAIAMMGKSDDIAKVLARTYNLLGDSMDQTLPVGKQMELMSAKLYKLWKTNAFEIEGMNQSLLQFLPTANTANFTFDETASLLAALNSAAVVNSRAGRLLRTSLMQQQKNYAEIGATLGIYVNPQMEDQFTILMKILEAVDKLSKSGKDLTQVNEALTKIFGGTRGQEPIKALAAVFDLVRKNLKDMGVDADNFFGEFNDRVDTVTDGLDTQLKITERLKEQLKLTFIQGAFGGDDFATAIKSFNTGLKNTKGLVYGIGKAFSVVTNLVNPFLWPQAFGADPAEKYQGYKSFGKKDTWLSKAFQKMFQNDISKEDRYVVENARSRQENIDRIAKRMRPGAKSRQGTYTLGTDEDTKTKEFENELKYLNLTLQGYDKIDVLNQQLIDKITRRIEIYNNLEAVQTGEKKALNETKIISAAINHDWESLYNWMKVAGAKNKEFLEVAKNVRDVEKERASELLKINDALKSAFEGGLNDLFSGKENDFLGNLSNAVRDIFMKQISKGITNAFFKASGFGDMFSRHASLVEQAIKRGADYHAARLAGGKPGAPGFATGGPLGGGGLNILGGALNAPVIGQGTTIKRPPGFIGPMPKAGFASGGISAAQAGGVGLLGYSAGSSFYQAAGGGGLGIGAGVAGGLGAGMLGLGALAASGIAAGTATAGVGLLGTIGASNAWNPVGWALLAAAAVMAIIGMNKGKPEWTKEDTQEQTKAIGSRIDVTNKQLEWVNRNLVALRQEITYILPDSAYFSERAPEDRFAIDAQRGALT